MGLIIKSTEKTPILITGTDIKIPEVYGRVEFAGRIDGITLDISVYTYASIYAFMEGKNIYTSVRTDAFSVSIDKTEIQSLDTALKYAQSAYESLGYEVSIG